MVINISYFIAICALLIITLIIEYAAYYKSRQQIDSLVIILGLYVKKFGEQTFDVEGEKIEFKLDEK